MRAGDRAPQHWLVGRSLDLLICTGSGVGQALPTSKAARLKLTSHPPTHSNPSHYCSPQFHSAKAFLESLARETLQADRERHGRDTVHHPRPPPASAAGLADSGSGESGSEGASHPAAGDSGVAGAEETALLEAMPHQEGALPWREGDSEGAAVVFVEVVVGGSAAGGKAHAGAEVGAPLVPGEPAAYGAALLLAAADDTPPADSGLLRTQPSLVAAALPSSAGGGEGEPHTGCSCLVVAKVRRWPSVGCATNPPRPKPWFPCTPRDCEDR